jgi:archaemetzincin
LKQIQARNRYWKKIKKYLTEKIKVENKNSCFFNIFNKKYMKKIAILIFIIFCSCSKEKAKEIPRKIPKETPAEAPYFKQIKSNDVKLPTPVYGDWLYSRKDKGQTFEQYFRSNHIVPAKDANIIYIRPIGNFTSLQKKQIQLTNEYLEIYFQILIEE